MYKERKEMGPNSTGFSIGFFTFADEFESQVRLSADFCLKDISKKEDYL